MLLTDKNRNNRERTISIDKRYQSNKCITNNRHLIGIMDIGLVSIEIGVVSIDIGVVF